MKRKELYQGLKENLKLNNMTKFDPMKFNNSTRDICNIFSTIQMEESRVHVDL